MRCALYARYSSENQNDRSIADQVRNCKKLAEGRGWSVLGDYIFEDKALSGTTVAGRPGLAALRHSSDARPRPFDYVLIDDTSRLSRDSVEQGLVIRDLRDNGIFVYFVSDGIDTKDESTEDVLLPVFGIKDSLYSRDLAKKTKRGMEGQVLKGFNPGGRLYGYKYTPVPDPTGQIDKKTRQVRSLGTQISVEEREAEIVHTIFSMYASGLGLKAIACSLNEQEVDPPGKERQARRGVANPTWCPSAIRAMLRNPRFFGDWSWNRHKWVRKRKTGKRVSVERPRSEWVEHKDPLLAIVDHDLWKAVQERNDENAKRYSKGVGEPRKNYLMSGLIKCGICDARLIVVGKGSRDDAVYGCSFNWHRGAKACPNNIRITRSVLEDRVIYALERRLMNPDMITLLIEMVNREIEKQWNELRSDRQRLLVERKTITDELQNLIRFIARGNDSAAISQAILDKEAELEVIESQMARASGGPNCDKLRADPKSIVAWVTRLKTLVNDDITAARVEIGKVIGELIAIPASQDRKTGLILEGKPKVAGVLGLVGVSSTPNGSGERV